MQFPAFAAPADVAIEVLDGGGLQIAPALLRYPARREVGRSIAALLAVLEITAVSAERTAVKADLCALVGEAVLELNVQRTAERVQTEHRVGPFKVHLFDRDIGYQVEIDRIAESRVETDTVDVDSEPLRRSLQRRSLE